MRCARTKCPVTVAVFLASCIIVKWISFFHLFHAITLAAVENCNRQPQKMPNKAETYIQTVSFLVSGKAQKTKLHREQIRCRVPLLTRQRIVLACPASRTVRTRSFPAECRSERTPYTDRCGLWVSPVTSFCWAELSRRCWSWPISIHLNTGKQKISSKVLLSEWI